MDWIIFRRQAASTAVQRLMASEMVDNDKVGVLIVGFRNPQDIALCLAALAKSAASPSFDVYICENGGGAAYDALVERLLHEGLCVELAQDASVSAVVPRPFLGVRRLRLVNRDARVMIGCAEANLGYAGGVNAWLRQLIGGEGWKGVWLLNPDTEPRPDALDALVRRAESAGKGMVGSTILEAESLEFIRFRGGLCWRKFFARGVAIGLGDRLDTAVDVAAIERAMDGPSGASMYVTRSCVEKIGLMDESFFLFFEDLDWGVRAKELGLGYASASVVAHQRGTTTGSAGRGASLSRLVVYLEHRNAIRFVWRYYPWALPMRVAVSMFEAARFLLRRAPANFLATLSGLSAGLRGEKGAPKWYLN